MSVLIAALKPGHDGSIAVVEDGHLLCSIEAEKDSGERFAAMSAQTVWPLIKMLGRSPDVWALGGWLDSSGRRTGAGYLGLDAPLVEDFDFDGRTTKWFSSSHERSHLMMALGMAPKHDSDHSCVLIWEGYIGSFYLVDRTWRVVRKIDVMLQPGDRFAFLFELADPEFKSGQYPRPNSSGKLMALAAYGDETSLPTSVSDTLNRLLQSPEQTIFRDTKWLHRDSPLYNAGVESELTKAAAKELTRRIFDRFASIAQTQLPPGLPLLISGGCGLNCEWNRWWRDLGHFSSVFVPPCTNDSGSAIGTAIDAAQWFGSERQLSWSVYSGRNFEMDVEPDPIQWQSESYDLDAIAQRILSGAITAWVQGPWEMGPRALGHRSILATPFEEQMTARLNALKRREEYRPIAPCCLEEDLNKLFDTDFADPYMLHFRHVMSDLIPAVTHVDKSARVQTVSSSSDPTLHQLLHAVRRRSGYGILCNTSLNEPGKGFFNRASSLMQFSSAVGIDQVVIDDRVFVRIDRATE